MVAGAITFLYRRLGKRYPLVFMAVELQSALFIVAGTLGLFTFYFEGDGSRVPDRPGRSPWLLTESAIIASLCGCCRRCARCATGSAASATRSRPSAPGRRRSSLPPADRARPAAPGPDLGDPDLHRRDRSSSTCRCWRSSRCSPRPRSRSGYSAMLHYLAVEAGMRPLLLDINSQPLAAAVGRLLGGPAAHPAAGRAAADQPDHRARRRRAHLRRRRRRQPRRSTCSSRCWSRRRSRSSSR